MKKNLYFILAGVVALASSCVKETEKIIDDTPKSGAVCITVKMDPETKATIAESDGAFRFSSGDAIMIFDGTAVKSGTTTSTDNTGSFAMEDGFDAEGSGYAGFPGSLVSDITADGVVFTLPTSYEYAAVGNSDPDAAKVPVPMMGTYTGVNNAISLKQAGALIRFRVTNVAAGTLTFTFPTNVTGTLGTAITTPSGTNDGILAANLTNAGKTITVTDVPETTSGNYIFITLPVPTGTATSGIKVVNNSDSRMAMPSGSGVGLNRANGYKMGIYYDDKTTPLTFEAKVAGAIVCFTKGSGTSITLQYSTDGTNWYDFRSDFITLPNIGDKVSFRATLTNGAFYGSSGSSFYCNNDCYIYGNIMSLLSKDDFATMTSVPDNAFKMLFYNNEHILNHPSKALILPATSLAESCYNEMFEDCTALTSAPALPATTLASGCYQEMFSGCSALTTGPALPATSLAENCYNEMFSGCTSLQTAPALPATTLAMGCYSNMFSGCTSLQTAPALSATTLAMGCYNNMFSGCTSLQTAPALPATSLATSCYCGMFWSCTSLTCAPDLPATTLAENCYWKMFARCSQLGSAPDLPATTLAEACYQEMFSNCTSLTTAPTLPAPTLVDYCYYLMFEDCNNLNSVTCLATNISASYCTYYWLDGVAGTGTFIKAPSMTSWTLDGIPSGWTVHSLVNLASLTDDYTAQNGDIITGTLANNVKISIADGATVTLAGVSINADGTWTSGYAGITCEGDATINLAAGTTNTVKGIGNGWPGIYVPRDYNSSTYKTLTIQGSGTLNASARNDAPGIGGSIDYDGGNIKIKNGIINITGAGLGAGIGAGYSTHFGTITISGGTVTATAGSDYGGAGIGTSGAYSHCGNILIDGGSVTAIGGEDGPGIGSGYSFCSCGTITIATTITSVTAIKGKNTHRDEPCIGKGYESNCGLIYFGSSEVYNSYSGQNWISPPGMPTTNGTYGGLYVTVSKTNVNYDKGDWDTWTLTKIPTS